MEVAEKAITAVPRRIVETEAIRKGQEQQPVIAAVKIYVENKVLPKGKLIRISQTEGAQRQPWVGHAGSDTGGAKISGHWRLARGH